MPTLHIKIKVKDTEIEIKADGELDKETVNTIKSILTPLTSQLATKQNEETETRRKEEQATRQINIYSKFRELIPQVFQYGQWFTSIDAREAFYDTYGIDIKTSTASTYLRRMEADGLLKSKKEGKIVKYRVVIPAYAVVPDPAQNKEYY